MRGLALAVLVASAGCAAPERSADPSQRYAEAVLDFDRECEAMLRFAGRNRLRCEGSAGRARAALVTMKDCLAAEPAGRLEPLAARFEALSRAIPAGDAVSGGQELAVKSIRDTVLRDFAPAAVEIAARKEAPAPVPAAPDAFARWEKAHAAFETSAKGNGSAQVVQDYSEVRASMEALAATEEDRLRVERFLREYERLAGLVEEGKATVQDLKGLPVLESDIRAAFGGKR